MFVLTEKIAPIHRPQELKGRKVEDAAREERDDDERWIKRIIDAMSGTLRRFIWGLSRNSPA